MTGTIYFLIIWAVEFMAVLVCEIKKNSGKENNGEQRRAKEFYKRDCSSCD